MTAHAQAANLYARRLRQTDKGRSVLAAYRDMIEDRSGIAYTNAIGQPFRGWSDGQVAAYSRVHHLVATDAVRRLTIPVDAAPGRDADREGNQRKLSEGLPEEFAARIHPGTSHHGDATLSWSQDTLMPWADGMGNEWESPLCTWTDSAPLEIGHTGASRTFLHLMEVGILARWPYDSTNIWLFFFADEDVWLSHRDRSSALRAA